MKPNIQRSVIPDEPCGRGNRQIHEVSPRAKSLLWSRPVGSVFKAARPHHIKPAKATHVPNYKRPNLKRSVIPDRPCGPGNLQLHEVLPRAKSIWFDRPLGSIYEAPYMSNMRYPKHLYHKLAIFATARKVKDGLPVIMPNQADQQRARDLELQLSTAQREIERLNLHLQDAKALHQESKEAMQGWLNNKDTLLRSKDQEIQRLRIDGSEESGQLEVPAVYFKDLAQNRDYLQMRVEVDGQENMSGGVSEVYRPRPIANWHHRYTKTDSGVFMASRPWPPYLRHCRSPWLQEPTLLSLAEGGQGVIRRSRMQAEGTPSSGERRTSRIEYRAGIPNCIPAFIVKYDYELALFVALESGGVVRRIKPIPEASPWRLDFTREVHNGTRGSKSITEYQSDFDRTHSVGVLPRDWRLWNMRASSDSNKRFGVFEQQLTRQAYKAQEYFDLWSPMIRDVMQQPLGVAKKSLAALICSEGADSDQRCNRFNVGLISAGDASHQLLPHQEVEDLWQEALQGFEKREAKRQQSQGSGSGQDQQQSGTGHENMSRDKNRNFTSISPSLANKYDIRKRENDSGISTVDSMQRRDWDGEIGLVNTSYGRGPQNCQHSKPGQYAAQAPLNTPEPISSINTYRKGMPKNLGPLSWVTKSLSTSVYRQKFSYTLRTARIALESKLEDTNQASVLLGHGITKPQKTKAEDHDDRQVRIKGEEGLVDDGAEDLADLPAERQRHSTNYDMDSNDELPLFKFGKPDYTQAVLNAQAVLGTTELTHTFKPYRPDRVAQAKNRKAKYNAVMSTSAVQQITDKPFREAEQELGALILSNDADLSERKRRLAIVREIWLYDFRKLKVIRRAFNWLTYFSSTLDSSG
ncbi:hypothetical protein FPCIR_12934 [Fusarium pseudocircinatum]|uniref:Uncharacterized protein n=1 Tax=Fusarium pseudocircinatum TaxID=56676 RepID=A0A8H5KNC2_9HYPO|nr:hypothetical protein FPCIR_12934 [Fusarium pseudocircinatum]